MNACRILDRLWEAEMSEEDIWFRQDYRQAFITVSLASKGNTEPFVAASYKLYSLHPDKVWPRTLANRKARLGKEFPDWYDAAGNWKPDVPGKKPAVYIPDEQPDRTINERLAAVLMFPVQGVQRANVEQAGSVRGPKKNNGNLYEMPATSRPAEHQPLRILPA